MRTRWRGSRFAPRSRRGGEFRDPREANACHGCEAVARSAIFATEPR